MNRKVKVADQTAFYNSLDIICRYLTQTIIKYVDVGVKLRFAFLGVDTHMLNLFKMNIFVRYVTTTTTENE